MPKATLIESVNGERSRPLLPEEYGMPADAKGLHDWSRVVERLEKAKNYWVCTAGPDGRPHAVPVWAMWLDDTLYFDGHPQTRWGRNMAKNRAISVHLESGDEVVILEGEVQDIAHAGREIAVKLVAISKAKYGYSPEADVYIERGLFALRPKTVYAWSTFPKTVTRWRFDASK